MELLKTWTSFFKPLKIRNLQIYWSGQVVSLIGMWLQVTAMGILAYHLSGESAAAVGLLAALNAAPFLLAGMALGSLGDRFDRRKVILTVQCCQMALAGILCALHAAGMLELWHLYAAGFLLGISESIAFPTQQAFVVDLVPKSLLSESIGMYSLVFNTCRSIGPPLAGVVIAQFGATVAFGLNALSFLPLVGCLVILKSRYHPQRVEHQTDVITKTPSGLKAVLGNRFLLLIMVNALIQNCFGQALYQIVPAIAHGDEHATGIILGAVGLGAVISILFLQPFFRMSGRVGLKLTGGVLWMGCAIFLAGLFPSLEMKALCFFIAGLATSMLFVTANSTVQLLAPPERKAGILGLYTIVSIGIQPMAGLGWGLAIDALDVAPVLMIVGGTEVLLGAALLLLLPDWRKWVMRIP